MSGSSPEELDRLWRDDSHWRFGVYRCPEDPRLVVKKRVVGIGWTFNFAHPAAIPALLAIVLVSGGAPVMIALTDPQNPQVVVVAIVAGVVLLGALMVVLSRIGRS